MDVFFALADPTRRNIVELLATNGQLSASDISKQFPISSPAISQHLKVLKEAKVVHMEKRAQQRIYQINPETMAEVEQWLQKMKLQWHERFSNLEAFLTNEIKKQKGTK